MARGEIHVELSVDFADDPKVRALARFGRNARPARDLYVQMICYCKRKLTDGFVPVEQVGILVYPDPASTGEKDVDRLLEVGLVEKRDGGYWLPGFLKRNRSRAQVEDQIRRKAEGAALSNHKRWHSSRGVADLNCPHCLVTAPNQSESEHRSDERSEDRSLERSVSGNGSESTETETETETEEKKTSSSSRRATRAPDHLLITDQMREWVRAKGVRCDLDRETERMLDHHRAKGSTFKDWTAAWRTWMSRADQYAPPQQATAGRRFFEQ